MKKLNERRDELAIDATAFCWCAGGTCSGCEAKTFKLYVQAFDAAIEELTPQVNKLVEAAKNIHLKYDEDVAFVGGISTLNDALTEWQEFIGDEK